MDPRSGRQPPVAISAAFGWDVLARESRNLRRPIVVTTASPWALARPTFGSVPVGVIEVESLERRFLDSVACQPLDGDVVVGIGGGMVLDAAKYVALRWNTPLMLVPTITSGNGMFTRSIAVRENGKPVGMRGDIFAGKVLVDYGLIQSAPALLNRSGIGDVLYLHTGEFDWRLAAALGRAVPWDSAAAATMRDTVDRACASAQEIGSVSAEGIRTLMDGFRASAELHERFDHPQVGAGSEHLFAWTLEATTGRHFIHGQAVCLGVVIMALLQRNDPERMRRAIEEARVPFHPRDLDLTWPDLERTLRSLAAYNQTVRRFYTICDEVVWNPRTLREIQEFVS